MPRLVKSRDSKLIATNDHLIKEKIELLYAHLPTDGAITCEPDVRLLCDGRIEIPRSVRTLELGECCRIAVFLTKEILRTVYQGCSWTKLEFLVYKGLIRVVGHGNPRLAMGTHGYPPFLLRKWVGERGYPWAPTIFSCDELCAIWELGVSGHGLPRVSVWR